MPATLRTAVETGATGLQIGLRPPLRWAGGKRWQLPHLRPLWEPHRRRRLVEPFCGGLAVALGLNPERALLNDANPHLISFYRWLQRGLTIDLKMRNDPVYFHAHRERFNRLVREGRWRTAEAASLFYYLNRTGYNGLCRFNQGGSFNVPFGRYAEVQYLRDFWAYRAQFGDWAFSCVDATRLPLRKDDYVYADPPYDVEFMQPAAGGFDWEDQLRTAEWLAAHPGPVVLVNQATDRIVRLYRALGFQIAFLDAPRRFGGNGDRTATREVIATHRLSRSERIRSS
jgi:DNA adenine methylase